MLRLTNIKKNYVMGEETVYALKGLDINFRKNEFVSVLGPSGCGKTTLLNIIGGLDKYTSGDLIIAGKSTKEFKDRDWDVYRNHRVGFVFQSYNLIPHQSVLGNVELALTIAGLSKTERVERARRALERVGLADKINKMPNQLSGGQCQRVAIARALVNEPEILLADEPTGALDTETSVQIMELIKEIAKERLVIMVTHNPELAERYSTRIIKLLDGNLLDDSNPYSVNQEKDEVEKSKNEIKNISKENAKMSSWTAFKLSLKNLLSKKRRTIMTIFAGSIGIIGISLVLSISYGVKGYVADMQNDMLSGSPITITQTTLDIKSLMNFATPEEKVEIIKDKGQVNIDTLVKTLVKRAETTENMMISNKIEKNFIDYLKAMPKEYLAAVVFDYGHDVTKNLYTEATFGGVGTQNMSLVAVQEIYTSILKQTEYKDYASFITSLNKAFAQSVNDKDYVETQYNILAGEVATKRDEIMIVLNKDRQISDLLLTQLGYYTQDEFLNIVDEATGKTYNKDIFKKQISYEDIMKKTFTYYPNDLVYNQQDKTTNIWEENFFRPFTYNATKTAAMDGKGVELKIVGIIEPKEEIKFGCLQSGFYYTEELSNYINEVNNNSEIVNFIKNENDKVYSMPTEDGIVEISRVKDNNIVIASQLGGIKYSYSYVLNEKTISSSGNLFGNDMYKSIMASMGMGSGASTLSELGGATVPSAISIYPSNFEDKELVLSYLDAWNDDSKEITVNNTTYAKADRELITYMDSLSIIMGMINSFINVITIALVGFTALSLVVSSVMIGIITYVSVMERVKEIGVIRSLGGRKKDVSFLFTAETFMIGLTSGVFGVAFTYFAGFIINIITKNAIQARIAILPIPVALIMILISVFLTFISGVTPSRSAAKKDPVVALRTE